MLREREDHVLMRLLLDRPDLAFPAPTDFSQIASRATTRHSVTEALGLLNAFELWVALRACAMPAPFSAGVLRTEGTDDGVVTRAAVRLVDLGLIWGHPDDLSALRPVRAMAALLGDADPGSPPPASPPTLAATHRTPSLVDRAAAGSAFEFVRRMDVLVEHCDHQPARLRRSGGLATREVRGFATLLDVPSGVAAVYLELARLSGLLGLSNAGTDEVLRPTREFDGWQMQSLSEQWAVVAEAWFERHDASGRTWLKRLVLDAFGDPADGRVIALADVQRWLAWHRPRRPTGSDRAVTTMLEQAAWIGITGVDALSSFGPTVDVKALDALLPQRVDHVVIQADLTAIAPGPLTPEAAHDLGTIADVESRGGATVYRISPESLRRAHGLGWTVSDLVETLQQRSRTPLPQALGYLINDLSRLPAAGTATFRDPSMRHRSPARGAPASADEQTTPEDRLDLVLARDIVAVLRSEGAAGKPRQTDHAAPDLVFDSPLATLREAVETGEVLWVGYVDATGASTERLVKASAVDDGLLQAHDARSREEFTVPVHRVTAAHIIRSST